MSTDLYSLCAELVERIESDWEYDWKGNTTNVTPDDLALVQRARTALAEGAGVGATDEELKAFYDSHDNDDYEWPWWHRMFRELLARFGTHPRPIPVPEGDGVEPTDDEIDEIYYLSGGVIREFARLLLARYGTHPRPIPVAERLPAEVIEQAWKQYSKTPTFNDEEVVSLEGFRAAVADILAAVIPLPTVEPPDPNNAQPNT